MDFLPKFPSHKVRPSPTVTHSFPCPPHPLPVRRSSPGTSHSYTRRCGVLYPSVVSQDSSPHYTQPNPKFSIVRLLDSPRHTFIPLVTSPILLSGPTPPPKDYHLRVIGSHSFTHRPRVLLSSPWIEISSL